MSDPRARGLVKKSGTDINGRRYTRHVRAEDEAARAGSQSNGFLSPSVTKMPSNSVPGAPVTSPNGTTSYFNASGQLHRAGGLPAIEYKDGRADYYENGQCVEHSYPGIPYDTGLTIHLAQAYNARTAKFQRVYSSYTRPAVTGAGRQPEYWLHGVKLRDEASWTNAKKMSYSDFDQQYGNARVPVLTVSERFERMQDLYDQEG